ncbi:MAG: hypothetical protein Kow00128_08160 [Deltaproteobacteria bacterium]
MTPDTLTVSLGDRTYDIFFGSRIYPLFQEWICRFYPGGSVFVVTDRNVHSIYGEDIRSWLSGIPHRILALAPGEEAKTWEQVREIYTFLARGEAGRDSLIVAFGGGVVGDLAGFAAASFLRGIPYVQIPTTLLAQVDSSVGGKTGFNLPEGKNLVGAFHQPRSVFVDDTFLLTLNERNLRAGMAEVVKSALAGDRTLLTMLFGLGARWNAMSGDDWRTVIRRAVAFKASVVERDETETSLRRVLNLGHTIGHAVEQATGYTRFLHGEAVGLGLAWELLFSRRRNVTPPELADRAIGLLADQGFSLDDPGVSLPSIASAIGMDKKRARTEIEMPMVTGEGEVLLERVAVADLRRELPAIRAEIREWLRSREEDAERKEPRPAVATGDRKEEEAVTVVSIRDLERRVVANPRDLEALLALAEAYRRDGNGPGAWEMAKEALHQYPSDLRAQRIARRIEQEFGGTFPGGAGEEAPPLEDLVLLEEEAFELRPAEPVELAAEEGTDAAPEEHPGETPAVRTITMADVYWKQGRKREALEIVRGIAEAMPGNARAVAWLDAHRIDGEVAPAAGPEPPRTAGDPPVLRRLRSFLNTLAEEYGYVLSRDH